MSPGEQRVRSDSGTLALAPSSVSVALLALVPKCPACLVLLLSPLGLRWDIANQILIGVMLVAVAMPLLMLRTRSCRRCAVRPCCLALLGVVLMVCGRLTAAGPALLYAGAAIVSVSLLWTARLQQSRTQVHTQACT